MSASIMLMYPKFEVNVANVKRAAACFGADTIYEVGRRYIPATGEKGDRKPRPLRMKAYNHVEMIDCADGLLPQFDWGSAVIVEKLDWAVPLPAFKHPENAVYIFGPEDGSVPKWITQRAKLHTVIPGTECMNLATAACVVLYDRVAKLI